MVQEVIIYCFLAWGRVLSIWRQDLTVMLVVMLSQSVLCNLSLVDLVLGGMSTVSGKLSSL